MMEGNGASDQDAEILESQDPPSVDGGKMECDSSSSDVSDDDYDEELTIQNLEEAVRDNPNDYEARVKLIKCLRTAGKLEKLRAARETMKSVFPLNPTAWREWASDEASFGTGMQLCFSALRYSKQSRIYTSTVFQDYMSVPLWCDYLNFVQEHDESVSQLTFDGVTKMRDLFEQALIAGGLHIVEGGKIWDAYREFEQSYCLTIDDADLDAKAKQIDHIRSIFLRQLSVPLANMNSTLSEYKQWEVEQGNHDGITSDNISGVASNIASACKKATEMYNARVRYEEQLSSSDVSETQRFKNFMSYIKFEDHNGDPVRTQVLYERAITEFPVSNDLWLSYTNYVDKTLKVSNIVKEVYFRATRNCPWVAELWTTYLLSLERLGSSEDELSLVFERALQCTFSSFAEYLDLFLTRIDGLRRKFSSLSNANCDQNYQVIRDTFQCATDYLLPHMKYSNEFLHLHAYWARLEVELAKDLVSARGVWEKLIKSSGSLLDVWQGYIAMEIGLNNINDARSIYRRCYSKRFQGTGSTDICTSWLRFEREHGTLENLDHARKKVSHRMEELLLFQSQQELKHQALVALDSVEDSHIHTCNASRKRKTDCSAVPHPTRQKQTAGKKASLTVAKQGEGSVHVSESSSGLVEPSSINEQLEGEKESRDAQLNVFRDKCTTFVSNISPHVTEEHLWKFFSDIGGVTAVRLVRDKFTGKSRCIGYVDFSDDEHLEAALKQNKLKLLGKKISIVRSDPDLSKRRAFGGNTSFRGRGERAPSVNTRDGGNEEFEEPSVQHSLVSHRRGGHVQLNSSNTFAMPRNVSRSLGVVSKSAKSGEGSEAPLKSNDEFRKMFLK